MQNIVSNLTKQIRRTQQPITILFSDIVGSTEYWGEHGDIEGRLMIDRHNRLMFPIVTRYDGKVIKTIGDSIMASFNHPEDAINAAAGMQQYLKKARQESDVFVPVVRIGIHTGEGIVENHDVFGDVVNVASRIESEADGNEILVSGRTASAIGRIKQYQLSKKGQFTPRGKSQSIDVYSCNWEKYIDLTGKFKTDTLARLMGQQKSLVILYFAIIIGTLYLIYNKYLRFFISDSQEYALIFLNNEAFFRIHGIELMGITIVLVAGLISLTFAQLFSHLIMRVIRSCFGFCVGFLLFYAFSQVWQPAINQYWDGKSPPFLQSRLQTLRVHWSQAVFTSTHLFVEVLIDKSPIYKGATTASQELRIVNKGTLLLLADTTERNGYVWNKVLVDKDLYGWIQRREPAQIGLESKRISIANKFYFKYKDVYMFLFGLLGFIWAMLSFRIKPL